MRIGMCISTAAIFAACGSVRAQNVSVPTSSTNQVTPSSSITATSARPSPTPSTQPIVPTSQPSAAAVGGESSTGQLGKVVVTSDLDQSREQIAPSLGAGTYSLGPTEINIVPQGENANFQQILLRAPGVVQDSFGQEHVRGEHANLTYRVNGVLLPQPLNGFGQELDTRLIDSVTLIDGSLPAQFGFHTAGIVDVQTKSGDTLNHNEVSVYGGSYDTIEPSIQVGGTDGKLDYFFTGSYNHNGLGIENPTDSYYPIHDYTDQQKLFGYMSYRIDDTSRLSLLMNASNSNFEIPNTPDLPPLFVPPGSPTPNSSQINENQNEQEYYTVLAYQKSGDNVSFQISGFSAYGQITFSPDQTNDLIFQGVSSAVYNNFVTNGVQFDSSYIVNDQHTMRAGVIADYTVERLNSTTGVFPVDPATGVPDYTTAFYISDNSGNQAWESGVYVQDEWRLTKQLTLNYGVRYDRFDANFDNEDQVSPRANLVWKIDDKTTTHVGYARYFVPPPVQNIDSSTVQKFANTTNAPENFLADPPKVERSNYYDIGISRQMSTPWTTGIDGFYKQADNLVDLGQFGAALIETPFNYKTGMVYGAEWSNTYKQGGFSAFGNAGWVEAFGRDIISQQFQIDNDELAYIATHDIHLDHQSQFEASAGASYQWKNDLVYVDFLYGSGLRSGFANTGTVGPHYPVNVGYQHIFHPSGEKYPIKFRCDVINIFDEKYEIRDGSGIGVGAPQFGQRLSFYAGISCEF